MQNLNKKSAGTFWICPEKIFNMRNTVKANERPLWRSTQSEVGRTWERMIWQDNRSKSAKGKEFHRTLVDHNLLFRRKHEACGKTGNELSFKRSRSRVI